jgi:molybdopterin-guanine dinucleotide biosynthesis protein A
MGRDKRLLVVDWEREPVPLWRRQLTVLRRLAPVELLISGPGDLEYPLDAKVVPDEIQDAGPLAGIASCLEAAQSKLLLILAVDLANITPDYLMSLVEGAMPGRGVVPAIGERLEPVAAVYPVEALTTAFACLQAGELSVQAFARRLADTGLVSIRKVTANEAPLFRNWNSPLDREET